MTRPAALHTAAARFLGPCTIIDAHGPAVARVVTESGDEFIVKQHATRPKHQREVYAYHHWAAALGPAAPELIGVDDQAMVIITSALPGRVYTDDLPASVHRHAGALLRSFHDAEPKRALPWFSGWLHDRATHWRTRAASLLSADETETLSRHLAAIADADIPPGGPCHLDFQPRNWLVNESGHVSLIDFEHARIDLPVRDFVRLRFRIWASRPDLRDAFLDGYGRPLTQAEHELTCHLGAIDALTALARGHETADQELTAVGRATLRQLREQS
jgi:tRNA A-37 threonylcarbamoyl transferase component Bud32